MLYVWNISWNDEGDREFIHFMDVPRLPISKVEKVFETKGKKLGSNTWVARRGWGQLLNCRMYTYISEKGTQVVLQSAFFLFHWISYQFLFILHKTSSSPLKIEGWKMEFDRLCSGSIYIYVHVFFCLSFPFSHESHQSWCQGGNSHGKISMPCIQLSWLMLGVSQGATVSHVITMAH